MFLMLFSQKNNAYLYFESDQKCGGYDFYLYAISEGKT